MPWFGNQAAATGALQLTDVDVFGHFPWVGLPPQGNPVTGGNLITSHVHMSGPPFGQPATVVQMAVYDATGMAPPLYPLVAVSAPFGIPAGTPAVWYSTPIVGIVTAGSFYSTAVLSTNGGAFSGAVSFSVRANSAGIRTFIVPGVFPNPLGAMAATNQEWLIYTTYGAGDDVGSWGGCGCNDI